MAKDKKFDLHKGGKDDAGFNLSKGGKRKFDLTKDSDEPEVVSMADAPVDPQPKPIEPETKPETLAQTQPQHPEPPHVEEVPEIEEEKKRNNTWMWIILALLIIFLLVWWLWPAPKDTDEKTEVEAIENVAADSAAVDSAAADSIDPLAAPAGEETAPDGQPSASPAAETPAATEQPQPQAQTPAPQPAPQPAAQPSASAGAAPAGSIEAEALNVIRGEYGNNPVRKEKLGARYQEIQKMVNQMKRNGKF